MILDFCTMNLKIYWKLKTTQSNIIRIGILSAQTGEIDVRIERPQCRPDVPQKATSDSSGGTNLTIMFHSLTGNESLATKRGDGRRIRNSQVLLGELTFM